VRAAFTLVITTRQKKLVEGRCVGCGCTDEASCPGGCHWVDPDHLLCSHCVERVAEPEIAQVEGDEPLLFELRSKAHWRQAP